LIEKAAAGVRHLLADSLLAEGARQNDDEEEEGSLAPSFAALLAAHDFNGNKAHEGVRSI
jgi:hypothetical protein